jgi:hypothetical protein
MWHNPVRVGLWKDGILDTPRRRIPGSGVEFEICSLSEAPPATELLRLERSLRHLYPPSPDPPILLCVAWSIPAGFWTIRMAGQRSPTAGFVDRTRELADRLTSAGHVVQAVRYPLDSPPDGTLFPPRS